MRAEQLRRWREEASPGFFDGVLGAALSAGAALTEAAAGVLDALGRAFGSSAPGSPAPEQVLGDPAGAAAAAEGAAGEALMQADRQFLRAGSVYQNPYMCIWNDCGVPVSAVMRMLEDDKYVLKVTNLDSKDRDSVGWIELHGFVELRPVPDAPHRVSVILKSNDASNAMRYDDKVFTRGANFMLSCMQRVSTAVLSAFRIEVDMRTDVVTVEPKAAPLRMFWTTTVAMEPTSEQQLWKPRSIKEGHTGPLPGAKPIEQAGHFGEVGGALVAA